MSAEVRAILTDGYEVVTESGGERRTYTVEATERRVVEDNEVVERGDAEVTSIIIEDDDGVREETEDVGATPAVAAVLDERGYDVAGASPPTYTTEDDEEPPDSEPDESVSVSPDVTAINGVGEARAAVLRDAGIETVEDVLDEGASGLVDAGVSEGVAMNIVENAA